MQNSWSLNLDEPV